MYSRGRCQKCELSIGNIKIKKVEKLKYLEGVLTEDGKCVTEIQKLIGWAKNALQRLRLLSPIRKPDMSFTSDRIASLSSLNKCSSTQVGLEIYCHLLIKLSCENIVLFLTGIKYKRVWRLSMLCELNKFQNSFFFLLIIVIFSSLL